MTIQASNTRGRVLPCPLLTKSVPAKLPFAPDVPRPCPRAVLEAKFSIAPLSDHLPVLRENHSRFGRSPTTHAQRRAAVMDIMECLAVAKLAAAAVEVAASSESSKSS